jgi:hypothetical protein
VTVAQRKIRDVLRLKAGRLTARSPAERDGIRTLSGAREAGIDWSVPEDVTDEAWERRLYPRCQVAKHRRPSTRLGET